MPYKRPAPNNEVLSKIKEGVNESGYSKITLLGDPFLEKAILEIDFSQENSFVATATWILFLELTSNGGKEAADWVHDSYPNAFRTGKEAAVKGTAERFRRLRLADPVQGQDRVDGLTGIDVTRAVVVGQPL